MATKPSQKCGKEYPVGSRFARRWPNRQHLSIFMNEFDQLLGGFFDRHGHGDAETVAIRALNHKVRNDARVDMVLVPIGDGLLLARRRH